MADSDLDTSIDCSKNRKFFTLPLDVTADSFIDSAPFDSLNQDHDQENEVDTQSPVKGRGKDSFSMTSYLASFNQSSEHSLQAGNTEPPIGPAPLSTQMKNNIIAAYSESARGDNDPSGLVGHLSKVLDTQDETITKLRQALETMLKEKELFQHETDTLSSEVDSLRTALQNALEERDRSISTTDLTSFMNLPDLAQDRVSNNHVIKLTLISQEVQTDEVVQSSNHTSTDVHASSPMIDNSTQYLNLGFMADSSSQVDHQNLVNSSVQVVPETTHAFTQVLSSLANTSSQAGTGFSTLDTSAQTNTAATAELGVQINSTMLDFSVQTAMPSRDSSDVLEKCHLFQSTISALREELGSVKNALGLADPSQFTEIVASVQALYEEQTKEMSQLKRNYSKDLDIQNEAQIQLRVDFEAMRQQKEEISRSAEQETTMLKTKIAQLEDAKKAAEHRLMSFSSRLSPEGSELDVDMSLTDSATQNGLLDYSHMSRTKLEYLTLTPPGCIDDGDVIEGRASSEVLPSVADDLKLQLSVLEKKYDVNRRYLEEQTADRELERDDFHRQMEESGLRLEEARREKERLEEVVTQQKLELDDYDIRLREATEIANELGLRSDKVDEELKSAVDKIYELREIIRDLEDQIDSTTVNVGELKEQNQFLTEALEKAEAFQREQLEEALNRSDDTYHTATSDFTEEIFTQVQDLAARLEAKLNEMDNFKWSSRPASSCSGNISVSTEDVSVRELSVFNRVRDVTAADLADGLRRLDAHFESFVRFEEVIIKKLRDTEMRLEQTRKRQEELEGEKLAAQNQIKEQILRISELESRLDQMRFEPSPNAVTMSGLRARVKALTEDLEEHKGQLQLKTMEVQDLCEKQEATQALLQKYKTAAPKREPVQVKRSTVYVQTEKCQIDTILPKSKRTQEIAVQTRPAAIDTGADYLTHPHHLLDISSIPGGQGPIHSTPNEGTHSRSSKRTFRSWVEGDYDHHRSPEIMRQMQFSKSDRLSTVPEMNRSFYSDDEQQKGVQVYDHQLAGEAAEGDDGLTEFVEVDDPTLILGTLVTSLGSDVEASAPSTAVLDQTRVVTSPAESTVSVENADGTNPPSDDVGLNKTSEGSLGGGAESMTSTGSASAGLASAIPSSSPSSMTQQKAPSRSGSATAESSGGAQVLGSRSPSTSSQSQGLEESSSHKIPFGISQSQTALPSQTKKGRSPCIPSDCVQGELLNEIQQLKEDKIRLEAKLEFTIESFREQQAKAQAATPPQPPTPPPPPPQSSSTSPAGPPNTDCIVTSPEQGLLLEQVKQLKKEREELERRLDQRQGQGEASQCEAERKIREASSQVTKLEREKRELEFRLKQLESNNEQRGRQLDDVVSRISQERNALQCEIQRASKELQDEIQKRNVLQTKFNNSLQTLERQREMDLRMRQENESLRANLEMLNSRVQTLASQARPPPVNNATGGSHCIEMYLRTKSYRKALTWQKKYLTTVIQGYKVLLNLTGAGFDHPDILHKQVLVNPSIVGLINPRSPATRFRICIKIVLAVNRMKFMVRRWSERPFCHNFRERKGSLPLARLENVSRGSLMNIRTKGRNRDRDQDRCDAESGTSDPRRSLSPALSLASLSGFDVSECETVLSQYMRRIQELEKEVGHVLHRAPEPTM